MNNSVQLVPAFLRFWQQPARFKFAFGGRGGAKSESFSDLLLEKGRNEPCRILNTREIQKSIKDSVHSLYQDKIRVRGMNDYNVTRESITNLNGSELIFNGLQDRTANTTKSLNNVKYCWSEEAQALSQESLEILTPSIRAKGSELWFSYNPILDTDPIQMLANNWIDFSKPRKMKAEINGKTYRWIEYDGDNAIATHINWDGNPFFPEELEIERVNMLENDPDLYKHIWGGEPKTQGDACILSRDFVRRAMDSDLKDVGEIFVGCDVARQGGDLTVAYKRKGHQIIDYFEEKQSNISILAHRLMEFGANAVSINVDDTGVGGGVTDILRHNGFPVVGVNNNQKAKMQDKYPDAGSEMWFEFSKLENLSIPNDPALYQELISREYSYDSKGRREIESKEKWKKKYKRSPDKADALLLCYYNIRILQKKVIFKESNWSG